MKFLPILLASTLAATALNAGTPVSKGGPVAPVAPVSLFGAGWSVSPYALYLTPDADIDETWGGGVALDYFFNEYVGLSLAGAWADMDGDTYGSYTVDLIGRYPIGTYFAPYVLGGGGVLDAGNTEILGRLGAGLEVKFSRSVGLFGDWTYAFPGGGGGDDDFEDYQMIRAGLRICF